MNNNDFTPLETVAFSGDYNDLLNRPAIPTVPDSLPANGGNAHTLDGKHATDFVNKCGDKMTGNLEAPFLMADESGMIQLGSNEGKSVRLNFEGKMTDIVTDGNYNCVPYHKILTDKNVNELTVCNSDMVDGKHADEFVLKSGDIVTGSLKVNGTPMSETDVIRKKEMDSSLNQVNELLLGKAEKAHTHTATEIGAETPDGAMDKVKVHNADVNVHKAILDKKVNLLGGELKDTVATFNESMVTEFPVVTSGGTLARILGDVKRNINSLVARVMGLSNPNLLINGDFQVWQRGTSFQNTTTNYTTDRWRCTNLTGVKIEKTQNGVKQSGTNVAWSNFFQLIEIPANLKGKKAVFSVCLKAINTEGTFELRAGNGIDVNNIIVSKYIYPTSDFATYSIDFNLTNNNIGWVMIRSIGTFEYEVKWAKLELGSYATPFVPHSYGEELTLCQRYYEKVTMLSCGQRAFGMIEYFKYTTTKRIPPIVKLYSHGSNTEDKIGCWNGAKYFDCPGKADIGTDNGFRVMVFPRDIPSGTVNLDFWYTADAEIY